MWGGSVLRIFDENYSAEKSKSKLKNLKRINIRGFGDAQKKWREGAENKDPPVLNTVFNTGGDFCKYSK